MSVGCWCENAVYVEGTRIKNYFIEITNQLILFYNFTYTYDGSKKSIKLSFHVLVSFSYLHHLPIQTHTIFYISFSSPPTIITIVLLRDQHLLYLYLLFLRKIVILYWWNHHHQEDHYCSYSASSFDSIYYVLFVFLSFVQ